MATVFQPFGLSCVGYAGASKPRASTYDFPLQSGYGGNPSTGDSIGSGDPVSLNGGYIATVQAPTSYQLETDNPNTLILGVFQSVRYTPLQQNTEPSTFPYWLSGTVTANDSDAMAAISMDPMQIYNIQANGPVAKTLIGSTFVLGGFANTNTSTGQSGVYMSSTPVTETNTAFEPGEAGFGWGQVKLIGLAPVTPQIQFMGGNAWSDAYTIVQVVLNNTHLKFGQVSVN